MMGSTCLFTNLCPEVQELLARFIQEEFTPLLLPDSAVNCPSPEAWLLAIRRVDPVLHYSLAPDPLIRICADDYSRVRAQLQVELS